MASLLARMQGAAASVGVHSLSVGGLTELATLDQTSDSWFTERVCRLTASDLPAAACTGYALVSRYCYLISWMV